MARTYSLLNALTMTALFLFLAFQPSAIQAQTAEQELPQTVNRDQLIQGWRAQLDQITSAIKREGISDDELIGFREDIGDIKDAAQSLSDELTPEIQSLTSRLDTLKQAASATLVPATKSEDDKNEEEDATTQTTAPKDSEQTTTADKPVTSEQTTPTTKLSASEIALNEEKAELESSILQLSLIHI